MYQKESEEVQAMATESTIRHAKCVLLLLTHQGLSIQQLATRLGVTTRSVYRYAGVAKMIIGELQAAGDLPKHLPVLTDEERAAIAMGVLMSETEKIERHGSIVRSALAKLLRAMSDSMVDRVIDEARRFRGGSGNCVSADQLRLQKAFVALADRLLTRRMDDAHGTPKRTARRRGAGRSASKKRTQTKNRDD
jgi:hypothetical protein